MRIDRNRWNNRTLAAALGVVGATALFATPASVLAQTAGTATSAAATTGAVDTLKQAQSLNESGKLVQARAVLDQLINSGQIASLGDTQRAQALNLLKSVDSAIKTADPLDVSIQKSELSLSEGDLLMAERHAKAVAGKSSASKAQQMKADAIMEQVAARRAELRPIVAGQIEQANADFAAGKYAESKAAIVSVLRSGIELSPEQASALERTQLQIVDLEQKNGRGFELSTTAGLLQPGNVRRQKDGEPQPGRPEPLPAVAGEQPADPAPAQAPAPAPAPAQDTPAVVQGQPMSSPAPSADDVVTQSMKAEAGRIITEADLAFDQARYSSALEKYTLVLGQFRPYLAAGDADRVQKRIDECRVRLGTGATSGGIAQSMIAGSTAIRERAAAEFANYTRSADDALSRGQADQASDSLARARLSISNARGEFNDAEFGAYQTQLNELQARIEAKRDEINRNEASKRETDLKRRAEQAESNRLAERDRKVGENIDRIRQLQQEKKYAEALQIVDQTLFMDPNNPTALLLRDILRDLQIYDTYNRIQEDKFYNHALLSMKNEEAAVPPRNLMDFPTDWPAKSFQRGENAAYAEAPENRRVLAQMTSPASKIQNLDLNENRFEDVLKFINSVTQIPVDADWESLAAIGVEKDTPVTLKVQNPITIQAAVERILSKVSRDQFQRAGWAVNDGILTVASDEALRKNKVLVIYNIQDLLFQIPNYRQVPQIDLNSVLQGGQGGGGQSPFSGDDQQQQQNDDPAVRERRVRQIVDIIYANVDFDGWKDNGGETGALQELNGSLIITNTPKNHREIVGLLSKLREIRNMQINVETKFLLVNQQWFEQIGFDLDIIFNVGSNQVTRAQANDPSVRPSDFFNFGSAGAGGSRGLQRVITGQGPVNGQNGAIQGNNRINQATVAPNTLSPIGTGQNSFGLTSSLAEGDFASGILGQAPALGIAGQFLDDIQVDFLIVATQADKRSVSLTAPRLTFTNGQTANIYVATQQAFISQLQPIVGDSAVGFNPQTAVVSEGVTMLLEGVISSDRRYVTLNVDSGVSRIDSIRTSPVTAIAGGQLVNSAATQSFIELPQVTVTRVRTTATVPDEGTLLLGGQRVVTEVEVETGVPILSKIPIINRFFTNRLETKEEQSLLILIKPTILIQTEEEEKSFPGLGDSVRSGIGIR